MLDVRDQYQAHPGKDYGPFYRQLFSLDGIVLVRLLLFSSCHKTGHVLGVFLAMELESGGWQACLVFSDIQDGKNRIKRWFIMVQKERQLLTIYLSNVFQSVIVLPSGVAIFESALRS